MTAKSSGKVIPMGRDIDDRLPIVVAGDSWANYSVYAYDEDAKNIQDQYIPIYDVVRSKDGRVYEITSNPIGQDKVRIDGFYLELFYER